LRVTEERVGGGEKEENKESPESGSNAGYPNPLSLDYVLHHEVPFSQFKGQENPEEPQRLGQQKSDYFFLFSVLDINCFYAASWEPNDQYLCIEDQYAANWVLHVG
jgi:hypothetical protein